MKCPACERDVAEGARFCAYCGAFAGDDDVATSTAEGSGLAEKSYWVCGRCHVENEEGDSFCGSCGEQRPGPAQSIAVPSPPVQASMPSLRAGPQVAVATPGSAATSRFGRRSIAASLAVVLLAGAVLATVLITRDGPRTSSVQLPQPAPSGSAVGTTPGTPTPTPTRSSPADTTPASWPGIVERPKTPFWGAFYCAGSNKTKAIQAAQVGHDAGWKTLVLWTGDYDGLDSSGKDLWVVCAGPFTSRSAAQDIVGQMDADARDLRSMRPDLDIHFGQAYVRLVQ